jgi:glycosyltransferase involved in cell wall biosynthesis
MDNTPKLSIILPVRNEAESLRIMVPVLEVNVEVPHEILVVYDFPQDTSVSAAKWLKEKYDNIFLVLNDLSQGVAGAVKKGVQSAKSDIILILPVDEVFPIIVIRDMLRLVERGCGFVSCTRYALGGKRLGGSFIGGILSRLANKVFQMATGSALTDATTGIKMFKKSVFERINIEADPVGWSFAFELSIKAQMLDIKIGEVPVVSVDRLFGGQSTFKLWPWISEYTRWFIWGMRNLDRFKPTRKNT